MGEDKKMTNSDDRKKAKSPFGNRVKDKAARKAAQGPDLNKTSIPELVEKPPEKDPNVIKTDDVLAFFKEQHSADTEVLPVDTTRVADEDFPPTEDAPAPEAIPPTEILPTPSTDIPPTQPDIPKIEQAIPAMPSQEERARIAGLETQIIANLDDTEETEFFTGTKTEELDAPTVCISTVRMKAIANEKTQGRLRRAWGKLNIFKYFKKDKAETSAEPAPEADFEEPLDVVSVEPVPASVAGAETEPLGDIKGPEDDYVHTPTEILTTDDEGTDASATGETEVPPEESVLAGAPLGRDGKPITKLGDLFQEPEKTLEEETTLPEPEVPTKRKRILTLGDFFPDLAGKPLYSGISTNEKYAAVLKLAAGEKVVIDIDNKEFWEEVLEDVDLEAEKNPANEGFRNYIFAVYASAKGTESKDKEILVYVLSELASANSDKGEHETALKYAVKARNVSKNDLFMAPNADTLHKWGMLEHNIKIYEKEMKENLVAVEAE